MFKLTHLLRFTIPLAAVALIAKYYLLHFMSQKMIEINPNIQITEGQGQKQYSVDDLAGVSGQGGHPVAVRGT